MTNAKHLTFFFLISFFLLLLQNAKCQTEMYWVETPCNMTTPNLSQSCFNKDMCCGINGWCSFTNDSCANTACYKNNCWSSAETIQRNQRIELEYKCQITDNSQPNLIPTTFTFDDGPNLIYTPRTLDSLKAAGVKAVFFVLGMNAFRYPKLIQRILSEGHSIGIHSQKHQDYTDPSVDSLMDMRQAAYNVYQASGFQYWPFMMRPPYGYFNKTLLKSWSDAGYTQILWDADPKDWETNFGADTKKQLLTAALVKNGTVILQHDVHDRSSSLVKDFIQIVQNFENNSKKLKIVSPLECFGFSDDYVVNQQKLLKDQNLPIMSQLANTAYDMALDDLKGENNALIELPKTAAEKIIIKIRYRCPKDCTALLSLWKDNAWVTDSGFVSLAAGEGTLDMLLPISDKTKVFPIWDDYLNSPYRIEGNLWAKGDEKMTEAWKYAKTALVHNYVVVPSNKKSGAETIKNFSILLMIFLGFLGFLI